MSRYVFKLPDLGEGTVEAELMEWHVKPGATVKEDDVIADVMTDKANVEIPSPVSGTVVATTGQPGDMIAVGSDLIVFETSDDGELLPLLLSAPLTLNLMPIFIQFHFSLVCLCFFLPFFLSFFLFREGVNSNRN